MNNAKSPSVNKKITILTPSFNQARYIRQCIESVHSQNYANVEHIIIDGGSTDQTTKILAEYPNLIYISEPDHGQSDALNKGLRLATGDIIGWINSDDFYEPNIFDEVIALFRDDTVGWTTGRVTLSYDDTGDLLDLPHFEITYRSLLRDPDIVRQQGAFYRRDLLEEIGGWNPSFYMVMDYDLWLRLSKICSPAHINKRLAYFRVHDDQKSTFRNFIKQTAEIFTLLHRERAPVLYLTSFFAKRMLFFFKGFIKNLLIRLNVLDKKFRLRSVLR